MHTTIPALHVGQGTHHAGLTIFPVWVDAPRIGMLDWAPASLRIAERADGAAVDTLEAENLADRSLVALEGDLLEGGWQNRMLARSMVLAPRERRALPALCVEQGRWGGGTEHTAGGRRASLVVRYGDEAAQHRVSDEFERHDRQSRVWHRIDAIEQRLGRSETRSFTHQLDRQSIRVPRMIDGQRGVIIGIGGRIMGLELFCSGSGLRSRYAGIVQSAAVDARLADPVATPAERARAFVRALQGRRLHGGEAGERWFEVARDDDRIAATGLGVRVAGGAAGPTDRGLLHLTALDRVHPLLAAV
ncbi:ARPP-1 family domain-containing protein [Microcella humidisoli]|uniref:ARG and Rhodanese-Phosphatase-superfamily-associated domain-containing protein n=1 Tax=Microcella humidisoli TaxID=2963406 RepID=A0ABY5FWY0_9MICO|nr:DUF6569 family protein [Microcella humidisoli]UTT62583.1 hypothetical protein NNL39_00220 [Microcella humidisoli]